MDAICDPAIERVVCMKGSQVGWTEIINNAVGYYASQDPCPILVIQPTLEMAEVWSKDRLAPMVRDTPILRDRFSDPASRDTSNTLRQKNFTGGRLAIIGANAPASLASRPIRLVLADEVDRYPISAGTEGDPLALAAKRQMTFWNRKTLIGSTPLLKETSIINREWLLSDQRRYFVPCHACDEKQFLKWQCVRWDKGGQGEHLTDTAHYVCEHCGSLWTDVDRWDAITKGEWIATAPYNGVAGFHIPGFLSSWLTLNDIVRDFLKSKDDPELLKVWVNTVLGDVFEGLVERVDSTALASRGESYSDATIPEGALILTAGVDVQDNRLELQVWAWGGEEEAWAVDYEIFNGDPAQQTVWNELDVHLLREYSRADGRKMRVRSACVDYGGHHGNAVIQFCKARRTRRVFPTKGLAGIRPVWPKRASRTKTNDEIYLIGVDTAKDTIYGRLKIGAPGPGYIHFPAGGAFDQAYYDQLTSEVVQTRYKEGRPYRVWVLPAKRRNEALDTAVLALAARLSLPIRLSSVRGGAQSSSPRPTAEAGPPSEPSQTVAPVPPDLSELTSPPQSVTPQPVTRRQGVARLIRRVSRSKYMG